MIIYFVKDHRRFGETCCLFLHCRPRIICPELICKNENYRLMGRDVVQSGRLSWIRRQYVPPKRLVTPDYTASRPRRLIVAAVRSANLIKLMNLLTILLQIHRTNAPNLIKITIILLGARGGAVGWGTALQTGRSRVRFPMVSLEFFIDIVLPAAFWPWGRLNL